MKLIEAISKIDNLKHNTFTQDDKVAWLSRLDGMAALHLADPREKPEPFPGYDTQTDVETQLRIPHPYDGIYLRWLEAQIDYANADYDRYNNAMAMFRADWCAYAAYLLRSRLQMPHRREFG